MKKILIIISAGLFLTAILVLGYFALFIYSVKTSSVTQSIGQNIEVTSDWQEFKLTEPLNFKKQVQYLRVSIDNSNTLVTAGNTEIKLSDGSVVNPEIEIIDSEGKTYQLKSYGSVNGDPKFTAAKNSTPNNPIIKLMRIKSDKNFAATEVNWVDMNLK